MATAAAERPRPGEPVVIEEGLAPKIGRVLGKAPIHLALLWLIPTLGLFITSILLPEDQGQEGWWNFLFEPSTWTFENYANMFDNEGIIDALLITAQVTIGATIIPIFVASLAAYALAWIDFPGRDWVFLGVIALMIVPIQMALIPMFRLYNDFALFDTIPGLILFHSAFALPFAIFLLRNFFAGIPRDLMEAARIDGASEFRLFFKVVLPLGLPTIAEQLRTFGTNLDVIAPASFFSAFVPLLIFAMFQRYFVQGLLAGSVK
jgi:alpha-glucoside transport system permease protein